MTEVRRLDLVPSWCAGALQGAVCREAGRLGQVGEFADGVLSDAV